MKNLCSYFLSIACFIAFFSCSQNEYTDHSYKNEVISQRSFPVHPFYELEYVSNQLGLNLGRIVSSSKVSTFAQDISLLSNQNEIISLMEDRNIYPCWSCAETDYNDIEDTHFVIVPVVDLNNVKVQSLLVQEISSSSMEIKYYDSRQIIRATKNNEENPIRYYVRMLEFYNLLIRKQHPDPNNYKYFKSKSCVKIKDIGCLCNGIAPGCVDSEGECQDYMCSGGTSEEEIDQSDTPIIGTPTWRPSIFTFGWLWSWLTDDIFPFGSNTGGTGGASTGTGSTNGGNNKLEEIDLFEFLDIITNLIEYIEGRGIVISPESENLLTAIDHFSLLTYPLDIKKELLSNEEISIYLDFIANHPTFIVDPAETEFLLTNSNFTIALDSYLDNYNTELGVELAHALLLRHALGLKEFDSMRESFNALKEVYDNHINLLSNYPDYSSESIDPVVFIITNGLQAFNSTSRMYELYKDNLNFIPQTEYEWQIAMEEFRELILTLLGFAPGIGDLTSAYQNFSQGLIFWGCFDILGLLWPNEVIKIFKNADKVKDAFQAAYRFTQIWFKIGRLSGTSKVWNRMPQAWKDLQHSKVAKRSPGLIWQMNPSSFHFRLMEAVPGSSIPNKNVPYARFIKAGSGSSKYMTVNGTWAVPTSNAGEFIIDGVVYHKTDPIFQNLTHIPNVDITDQMLDLFFNP